MKTSWDAKRYDSQCDFVSHYGEEVVALLNPQKGQRILDLGCGTGTLANGIAQVGAEVIGIDASSDMITQAKKNYPHLLFQVADGQNFSFDKPFDAVFSNAALHWMMDQKKVISCVWDCLKQEGRFVFEMGAKGNLEQALSAIEQAALEFGVKNFKLENYFPSQAEYTKLLEEQGFQITFAKTIVRPTPLKGEHGFCDWMKMFRNNLLQQIPESKRAAFFERMETIARPHLFHDNQWWTDYIRLRMIAIK